jgi:hypothetical protein
MKSVETTTKTAAATAAGDEHCHSVKPRTRRTLTPRKNSWNGAAAVVVAAASSAAGGRSARCTGRAAAVWTKGTAADV